MLPFVVDKPKLSLPALKLHKLPHIPHITPEQLRSFLQAHEYGTGIMNLNSMWDWFVHVFPLHTKSIHLHPSPHQTFAPQYPSTLHIRLLYIPNLYTYTNALERKDRIIYPKSNFHQQAIPHIVLLILGITITIAPTAIHHTSRRHRPHNDLIPHAYRLHVHAARSICDFEALAEAQRARTARLVFPVELEIKRPERLLPAFDLGGTRRLLAHACTFLAHIGVAGCVAAAAGVDAEFLGVLPHAFHADCGWRVRIMGMPGRCG
jgi:hypothetical protein